MNKVNNRAIALNIVNKMNEEQLKSFICLFGWMASEIPNEETLAAMEEAEKMLNDPNAQKFHSVEELFAELRS